MKIWIVCEGLKVCWKYKMLKRKARIIFGNIARIVPLFKCSLIARPNETNRVGNIYKCHISYACCSK